MRYQRIAKWRHLHDTSTLITPEWRVQHTRTPPLYFGVGDQTYTKSTEWKEHGVALVAFPGRAPNPPLLNVMKVQCTVL